MIEKTFVLLVASQLLSRRRLKSLWECSTESSGGVKHGS